MRSRTVVALLVAAVIAATAIARPTAQPAAENPDYVVVIRNGQVR